MCVSEQGSNKELIDGEGDKSETPADNTRPNPVAKKRKRGRGRKSRGGKIRKPDRDNTGQENGENIASGKKAAEITPCGSKNYKTESNKNEKEQDAEPTEKSEESKLEIRSEDEPTGSIDDIETVKNVSTPRRSKRDVKGKKKGYEVNEDENVNEKEDINDSIIDDLMSEDREYRPSGSTRGRRGRPPKRMAARIQEQQTMKSVEKYVSMQCALCEKWFASKKDHKKHMKIEHPVRVSLKKFSCEMCQEAFPKRRAFLQHLEKNHGISDMHKNDYQCPVCDRKFNAKNHVLRHRETLHAPSQQVPMKDVQNLESMNPNGPTVPFTEEMADKTEDGLFICFICKKLLDGYATYRKHLEFHREWIQNPERMEITELIKGDDEEREISTLGKKYRNPHVEHSYMFKEKNQKPAYQPPLLPNGQPIIQRIMNFGTVDASAIGGVIQENVDENNVAPVYENTEANQAARINQELTSLAPELIKCTEIIVKSDESLNPEQNLMPSGMLTKGGPQSSERSNTAIYNVTVQTFEETDDSKHGTETQNETRSLENEKVELVPVEGYSSHEKVILESGVLPIQSSTAGVQQVHIQHSALSHSSVSPAVVQMAGFPGQLYLNQPLLRHALTSVTQMSQGTIASQAPQLTELVASSIQHQTYSANSTQGGSNQVILQPKYQGQRVLQTYQLAQANVPLQQIVNQGIQQNTADQSLASNIQVSGYSGDHLVTHQSVANTNRTNTLPHVEEIMNRDRQSIQVTDDNQKQQLGEPDTTGEEQATIQIPLHQYLQSATRQGLSQQIVYAQSSGGHVVIPGDQSMAQIHQGQQQFYNPVTRMIDLTQDSSVDMAAAQSEPNPDVSSHETVKRKPGTSHNDESDASVNVAANSKRSQPGSNEESSESDYQISASKQVDGTVDPDSGSSTDDGEYEQENVESLDKVIKDDIEEGTVKSTDTHKKDADTEKIERITTEQQEATAHAELQNREKHPARLAQNRDPIAAAFAASVLGDNTEEISLEQDEGGLIYTIERISNDKEDCKEEAVAAVDNVCEDDQIEESVDNVCEDDQTEEFDVDSMCPFCKKIVDNLDDMYNHKMEDHGMLPVFKCVVDGCGKYFFAVSDHKTHDRIHPQRAFICSICNIHMPTMDAILGHKSVAHRNTAKMVEEISCPICHQLFKNSDELQIHIKSGGHKRYFQCNECGKVFRTQGDLMNHKPQHSGIRGFLCDICGSTFYNKNGLNRHRLMHFAKRSHQCDQCDKSFNKKEHLKRHIATQHVSDRPYKCTKCPKSFKRIDKLKDHQRMHSNEKPYVCELCGKGYRYREGLRYHVKTHDRPLNHLCGICGLKFSRPSIVSHHVKNTHGIDVKDLNVYPCQQCGHNFPRPERLQRHLERDHGIEVNWSHKCLCCGRGFPGKKSLETHLQKKHVENESDERPKRYRRQKKSETVQERLIQARKQAEVEQARIDAELQAKAENSVTQQLVPVIPPLQTVEIHTIKGDDQVEGSRQTAAHHLLQQMHTGAVVEVANLPPQIPGATNPMMLAVNAQNQQLVHIQSHSPAALQGQGQSQRQSEQTVIPVQQTSEQLTQSGGLQPGSQYAHGGFQYIAYSS